MSFNLHEMLVNTSKQPEAIVWTIAGSDNQAGAGIQIDLQVASDMGLHACSVVTAVTAQNQHTVSAIEAVSAENLIEQCRSLEEDYWPRSIKLGMLANEHLVKAVGEYLLYIKSRDPDVWIIADPVMCASNGGGLATEGFAQAYIAHIFPVADLITPNPEECQQLISVVNAAEAVDLDFSDVLSMARVCALFCRAGTAAVLLTGGDYIRDSEKVSDYFYASTRARLHHARQQFRLVNRRLAEGIHGSGCMLSSAVACCLAHGHALEDALVIANMYVHQVIDKARRVGTGLRMAFSLRECTTIAHLPMVYTVAAGGEAVFTSAFCAEDVESVYPVMPDTAWCDRVMQYGARQVQLRFKSDNKKSIEAAVSSAVTLQAQHAAKLYINDHWQLAIAYAAYGVHLGQEDVDSADIEAIYRAGLKLGISTHSWWELARAHAFRPSYIALGPIYPTATKDMPFAAQGIQQLKYWAQFLAERYALVAIGGIDSARARQVRKAGVKCIAVVSAITRAENPEDAYQALRED